MTTPARGTSSQQYLFSIQELEKNAATYLGLMKDKTYEVYLQQMKDFADKTKIEKPILAIGIEFIKEGPFDHIPPQAYPIREKEWARVLQDAEEKLAHTPRVFVVDGGKFRL